ncbi:hypothetical protein F5051DRAFT_105587 [Lentinula edodes]|nr:hypothetical protein F5051DRAFT_105587 [Lentinula edodes]
MEVCFLHTLFAIAAVVVTMTTSFELATPNVMLTVIGVLGFTISYRAASATPHAITRLIWYQVPPCRTLCTFGERAIAEWKRPGQELSEVMAEKKMALDLGEGFSVALKQSFSRRTWSILRGPLRPCLSTTTSKP